MVSVDVKFGDYLASSTVQRTGFNPRPVINSSTAYDFGTFFQINTTDQPIGGTTPPRAEGTISREYFSGSGRWAIWGEDPINNFPNLTRVEDEGTFFGSTTPNIYVNSYWYPTGTARDYATAGQTPPTGYRTTDKFDPPTNIFTVLTLYNEFGTDKVIYPSAVQTNNYNTDVYHFMFNVVLGRHRVNIAGNVHTEEFILFLPVDSDGHMYKVISKQSTFQNRSDITTTVDYSQNGVNDAAFNGIQGRDENLIMTINHLNFTNRIKLEKGKKTAVFPTGYTDSSYDGYKLNATALITSYKSFDLLYRAKVYTFTSQDFINTNGTTVIPSLANIHVVQNEPATSAEGIGAVDNTNNRRNIPLIPLSATASSTNNSPTVNYSVDTVMNFWLQTKDRNGYDLPDALLQGLPRSIPANIDMTVKTPFNPSNIEYNMSFVFRPKYEINGKQISPDWLESGQMNISYDAGENFVNWTNMVDRGPYIIPSNYLGNGDPGEFPGNTYILPNNNPQLDPNVKETYVDMTFHLTF